MLSFQQILVNQLDLFKYIKLISNICSDIDVMFKTYSNNSADIVELENKLRSNDGWVDVFNNLDIILEKYSNIAKEIPQIN
jgi:hypothetical protein